MLLTAFAAETADPIEPALPGAEAVQTDETPPQPTSALVVFEDTPSEKARVKVIRQAMRQSKAVQGGKDWGRALCFNFSGPAELELLEKASRKAKMPAEVRPSSDCTTPPAEALVDAPTVTIAVHLAQDVAPADIRNGLMRLLGIGGLGLTGVKTLDEPARAFCMEFVEAPEASVLDFTLKALPFATTSTETVEHCRDAFL